MCMENIAENLQVIIKAKNDLKNSINAKNAGAITDSTPFSAYPNSISAIETRTLDMSDRVVSDCIELKDYTNYYFIAARCVKEVNIPTTVTSFGESCFRDCSGLTSVTIPNSVTSFGESCFSGCKSLTGVTIPDSVASLPNHCFESCSSLTGITIPDGVKSLGAFCFKDCSSLKDITIPDGVTSLEIACFFGCKSLTSMTCKAITPPTLGSDIFSYTPSTLVIYVPAESVDAYKAATNWSKYADKIQAIA